MGASRGSSTEGKTGRNIAGWRKDDPLTSDQYRAFLAGGERTRFERKYPRPSVGDRFGELTVERLELGDAGGLKAVWARCSCGAVNPVAVSNLRGGKSTRCNTCAKKATARGIKYYWGYADILPDDEHRRRLLNRIASCIRRCSCPTDAGFPNYGGRGITVWWGKDKRAFLAYLITLEGWNLPHLELDRTDVNRGYEPGNLRFITKRQNQWNRRSVQELQKRIDELEARLRYYEFRPEEPIHD